MGVPVVSLQFAQKKAQIGSLASIQNVAKQFHLTSEIRE
jgi:hypothetical protein